MGALHANQKGMLGASIGVGMAPLHVWNFPNLENPKSPWEKYKPWEQEWAIFDAKINTKHIGKTLTPTPRVDPTSKGDILIDLVHRLPVGGSKL